MIKAHIKHSSFELLRQYLILLFVLFIAPITLYAKSLNQVWVDIGGSPGLGVSYSRQIPQPFELGGGLSAGELARVINGHLEFTIHNKLNKSDATFLGPYASILPGVNYHFADTNSFWFSKQKRGFYLTIPLIIGIKAAVPEGRNVDQIVYRLGFSYVLQWSPKYGFDHIPLFQFSIGLAFDKFKFNKKPIKSSSDMQKD